jgi:hypothetical protein
MTPERLAEIESAASFDDVGPNVVHSLVREIRRLWEIRDAVKRLRVASRCEDIRAIGPAVFDIGDTLDVYEREDREDGTSDAKEGE